MAKWKAKISIRSHGCAYVAHAANPVAAFKAAYARINADLLSQDDIAYIDSQFHHAMQSVKDKRAWRRKYPGIQHDSMCGYAGFNGYSVFLTKES